jgi:hypothetical protein
MRAPEEDRRCEHGILLGDVRRAGSLHCLPLLVEPTTALSARASQLVATTTCSRPNLPQSCVSAELSCVCVSPACAGRRGGQEARQRRKVLWEAQVLLSVDTQPKSAAAVPHARGTRTGLLRRTYLRRRAAWGVPYTHRVPCRGTGGPPSYGLALTLSLTLTLTLTRSSFYGEEDANRKADPDTSHPHAHAHAHAHAHPHPHPHPHPNPNPNPGRPRRLRRRGGLARPAGRLLLRTLPG